MFFKGDNVKHGFMLVGCYFSNVYQIRSDWTSLDLLLILSNIQCNCKLIMAGPMRDEKNEVSTGIHKVWVYISSY
jgi:hypothetical protein